MIERETRFADLAILVFFCRSKETFGACTFSQSSIASGRRGRSKRLPVCHHVNHPIQTSLSRFQSIFSRKSSLERGGEEKRRQDGEVLQAFFTAVERGWCGVWWCVWWCVQPVHNSIFLPFFLLFSYILYHLPLSVPVSISVTVSVFIISIGGWRLPYHCFSCL